MSVHLPKTPETVGLIGAEQLAKAKPSLVLVNAARGGIVDEGALYDALKTGRIAAAGLDVFAKEPCTDSPLFELENVVATPHLGASTDEAQEKAGIAVARSVRLALSGELVPDAVNVQGGVIAEDVRPGIPLTEKLGRVFTALAGEVAQQIDVEVRGEITEYDVKVLELAALKGVFADIVEDQVSYVNAPLLAAERGTAVRLVTDPESPDHRNLITIRGTLADGSQVSVSGTLIGINQKERLVEVNGFDVDLEPTEHLAFFRYEDRPGMVGTVGVHPRRRRGQHRRHAGRPRRQGRRGPGRALRRLRHPGRDPRRDRVRHRRPERPRRRPHLTTPPSGLSRFPRILPNVLTVSGARKAAEALGTIRVCAAGQATVRRGVSRVLRGRRPPCQTVSQAAARREAASSSSSTGRVQGIRTKWSSPPSAANTGPGRDDHAAGLGVGDHRGRGRRRQLAPQREPAAGQDEPPLGQLPRDRRGQRVALLAEPGPVRSQDRVRGGRAAGSAPAARAPGRRGRGRAGPGSARPSARAAPAASRAAGRPRTTCWRCRW